MMLTSINIAKATSNGFKQSLGICHIIITIECTLGCNITQSQNTSIIGNGIQFLGSLNHLVERHSRNIECLRQHIIIQIIVCTFLADIGRHTNGMQDKINLTTQHFHRTFEYIFQIFHTGCIGWNHFAIQHGSQGRDFAHTNGNRSVRQCNDGTIFNSLFCYFPSYGLFVQCTKNNTSFSFQQIVIHTLKY